MFRLIRFQAAGLFLVAAGVWGIWGLAAALSVLSGGGAVVVPSALYAWRLGRSSTRALPGVVLTGALLKILLSVLLLAIAVAYWPGLVWPAFIAGLILISLSTLAGPWVARDSAAEAQHIERILRSQRPPQN